MQAGWGWELVLGLRNNLYMNEVHHLTAAHHAAARVEEGCVPAMPHAHKLVDIRGSEAHLQTTDQSSQRTFAMISPSKIWSQTDRGFNQLEKLQAAKAA